MNAVIYARYSSAHQREESIDGQVRVCTEYAHKKQLNIIKVYADRAITGRTDNRPEFQRMIADAKQKLFDAVIVYKTDRFARNKYDSAIYKSQLKKLGISIHYAAEAIPEGPEGIILEALMEGLAEYYSAELGQKITRGLTENAYQCRCTGTTPLGYAVGSDHTYVVDPAGAELVRRIFDMYVDGSTITEIVHYLNERGFKTSKGRPFQYSGILDLITNRKYIGVYKYKDIEIDGGMPAIVSKEVFEMAQKEFERRKKAHPAPNKKADYLLSGKVYCGECGNPLQGVSGTSRNKTKYYYYKCKDKHVKIPKDELETIVVRETLEYVLKPDMIDYIAAKCAELNNADDETRLIEKQLSENVRALNNIQKAIEDGLYTRTLGERMKELEAAQDALRSELQAAKASTLTAEHIAYMLRRFTEPDEDIKKYHKRIISCFVSAVYLYSDKIVIVYNISDPNGGNRRSQVFAPHNICSTKPNAVRTLLIQKGYIAVIIKRV